jgi:thiol-disulfide isomerase/thioredoxin
MRRSSVIFAVMGLLFATLGAFWGHWKTTPRTPEAGAAGALYSHSFFDAAGQPHDMGQWRNKILVVNFWATWCAPCVEEMPELSELHMEVAPAGTHVLGIGIDSAENIARFAAQLEIKYPLYVGGVAASELARALGNHSGGLPYTVLIDRQGTVQKTYLGRLKMADLRRDLAPL